MRLKKTGIVIQQDDTYNLVPIDHNSPYDYVKLLKEEAYLWDCLDGDFDKDYLVKKLISFYILSESKALHTVDKFLYLLLINGFL